MCLSGWGVGFKKKELPQALANGKGDDLNLSSLVELFYLDHFGPICVRTCSIVFTRRPAVTCESPVLCWKQTP